MRVLLNVLQSQIGWFACVLGAASARPAIGVAIACLLIAAHVALTKARVHELQLLIVAALVGALADTALVQLGAVTFPQTTLVAGFTTPWMIVLWMVFATTLRHSLASLQTRLALAAVVGAVGGPAAYLAGARLGALTIGDSNLSYLAISAEWALALPLLLLAARTSNSVRAEPVEAIFSTQSPSTSSGRTEKSGASAAGVRSP
jgi:hypothetical protein